MLPSSAGRSGSSPSCLNAAPRPCNSRAENRGRGAKTTLWYSSGRIRSGQSRGAAYMMPSRPASRSSHPRSLRGTSIPRSDSLEKHQKPSIPRSKSPIPGLSAQSPTPSNHYILKHINPAPKLRIPGLSPLESLCTKCGRRPRHGPQMPSPRTSKLQSPHHPQTPKCHPLEPLNPKSPNPSTKLQNPQCHIPKPSNPKPSNPGRRPILAHVAGPLPARANNRYPPRQPGIPPSR